MSESGAQAAVIPFTQFLRPDGRRREVTIVRQPAIVEKAQKLIEAGCRFKIEELTTGQVSMTVERDDKDGETEVLAQKIVMNGPKVPPAVDEMVGDAFSAAFSPKESSNA
jgi:hypothetical protein